MSLTATTDAFGRVTITTNTPGSSFELKKSIDGNAFVSVATAALPAIVDNRPQFNFKLVTPSSNSFSFTGDCIGIYGPGVNAANQSVTIDGVADDVARGNNGGYAFPAFDLLWGVSGLDNIQHDVVVYLAGSNLHHYVYSDFSADYGDTIHYKMIIDGGSEEVIQVAPGVNRYIATRSFINRMVAGQNWTRGVTWDDINSNRLVSDLMQSLIGAYTLIPDPRLPGICSDIYDLYANNAGTDGIAPDGHAISVYELHIFAPLAIACYYAYKAFGDAKYLTMADKIIAEIYADIPRSTLDGYAECWNNSVCNQVAWALQALALAYNQTGSSHEGNSALHTIIINNADWQIYKGAIDASTGFLPYSHVHTSDSSDLVYGTVTYIAYKYISTTLNWNAAIMAKAEGWLSMQIPHAEPFFWRSVFYGYQFPGDIIVNAMAIYNHDSAIDQNYVDRLYSAAFDFITPQNGTGTDYSYYPMGRPAGGTLSEDTIPGQGQNHFLFYFAAQILDISSDMKGVLFFPPPPAVSIKDLQGDSMTIKDQHGNIVQIY